MGLGPEKIVEVVAEMDSALNRWFDMVPDHCMTFILTMINGH